MPARQARSPNAIGEPVLPPTPLSPDFDPLASAEAHAALSGFGGSLRSCCPKTAPSFAVSLHSTVPKIPGISRFARLRSPCGALCFAPFRSNCPKALLPSRFAPSPQPEGSGNVAFRSVRIVWRRSSLRAVPAEPPEGTSPIAVRSARPARKPPWHRIHSARFGPKVHQSVAGRSSAAGRDHPKSLSNPNHRRPSTIQCRSIRSSLRCLGTLPFSPVSRFERRRSAATHDSSARRHHHRVSVRQIRGPAVALARSFRTQQSCRPNLETACPHLADRTRLSKIKFLNFLPISRRTALVLDVMMLSPNPSRTKHETACRPCG